jgi:hypothetical protein
MDTNAISTAAFSTAMAQISSGQTQTALAAPSATSTNTPLSLSTFPPAGNGSPAPGGNPAVLPTLSFNTSPNTTPAAGLTPIGSPVGAIAPAATAALGDACHNNQFIADVTIPDHTVFIAGNPKGLRPGDDFKKVWRIKNTGSCKWDEGYTLVFIGGDKALDPVNFKLQDSHDFVEPGATTDIGVTLTAPSSAGTYQGTWRMQTDNGQFFGTPMTVIIDVKKK